jgi:hypothetical protein
MTTATPRSTSADYVTAFATGWPENQPHIMVLSLTTHKGVQDFAFNKEQALLIAKTRKDTAAHWPHRNSRTPRDRSLSCRSRI